MALQAFEEGRALGARELASLPDRERDALQLTLFPLLMTPALCSPPPDDRAAVRRLRALLVETTDPKAEVLDRLLSAYPAKTIVFTAARATARYLARRVSSQRTAAVLGDYGLLGGMRATRSEVLRAFAPRSREPPASGCAKDRYPHHDGPLEQGVNLQDAQRVIHYDLPWSPARLAQRVGRIDRLGSPHEFIDTVTFLPPRPLATALRLEERLAAKGRVPPRARRLRRSAEPGNRGRLIGAIVSNAWPGGACGCPRGVGRRLRKTLGGCPGSPLGELVEAIVVDRNGARANPAQATACLIDARSPIDHGIDRAILDDAVERAGPLLRDRLRAITDARWRAADRDRPGRRVIPCALAAARTAARRGDAATLTRLDALVTRLACGMTAGEEVLLGAAPGRRRAIVGCKSARLARTASGP